MSIYIYTFKKQKQAWIHIIHILLYRYIYIYIYACFCLHTYLTPLQLNHIYLSQSEAGHKILQCLPIRSTELVPSSLDSEHMVNMVTSEYNVRLPTGIGLTRLTGFPLHRVNLNLDMVLSLVCCNEKTPGQKKQFTWLPQSIDGR